MNKVLLAGRLTRDPEMRALASGKHVTQFSVATTEYAGNGKERGEFHNVVTWDRLAEVCGRYLGKGQQVVDERVGLVVSKSIIDFLVSHGHDGSSAHEVVNIAKF